MIAFMAVPAASRVALTVDLVTVTPTPTRATSGTRLTEPDAETVMVCGISPSVVGAPTADPGRTASAATATTRAPSASAPAVRMAWDMSVPLCLDGCGPRYGGVSAETDGEGREFPTRGGDPWMP